MCTLTSFQCMSCTIQKFGQATCRTNRARLSTCAYFPRLRSAREMALNGCLNRSLLCKTPNVYRLFVASVVFRQRLVSQKGDGIARECDRDRCQARAENAV